MQKPKFVFHCYLPFHSKGRKVVTVGDSIQKFMISNIKYVDDDPIFSVSGDIAMSWWYHDNGVKIALTGGHLSDEDSNDQNTHGLGIHSRLSNAKKAEAVDLVSKIEISNIQNCPFPNCKTKMRKVQGRNHGARFKSGPVYGNYASYVSNTIAKFATDQNLDLAMKSKKFHFTIALCLF